MATPYGEDLAYIHDVGFGFHATGAAPGILEILRRHGIADGLVVDLGCGSGILTRELDRACYDVLGVDLSAPMLRIARARVPRARFRHRTFLKIDLPPCAAVTAIGEIFNYLIDEANGLRALESLFARVHAALRPEGVFIFDIAQPGRGGGPGKRRQKNFQGDDWAILVETEEDDAAILTRRMTAFRRVGKLYRRSSEIHRLQLYNGAELAAVLRRSGFRVRVARSYGNYRLPAGLVSLTARKE